MAPGNDGKDGIHTAIVVYELISLRCNIIVVVLVFLSFFENRWIQQKMITFTCWNYECELYNKSIYFWSLLAFKLNSFLYICMRGYLSFCNTVAAQIRYKCRMKNVKKSINNVKSIQILPLLWLSSIWDDAYKWG